MSITKLNARTLYALGFDKVTVEALLNIARVVGSAPDSPTVPEVAQQADTTGTMLTQISATLDAVAVALSLVEQAPLPQLMQQLEVIQTEVRALAAQQAVLASQINDLRQGIMP